MTDTDGLLRDAGGARPASDVDALIERLLRYSIRINGELMMAQAAAALVQLREENARLKDALRQANGVRDVFASAVVAQAMQDIDPAKVKPCDCVRPEIHGHQLLCKHGNLEAERDCANDRAATHLADAYSMRGQRDALRASLDRIVSAYDAYRGKGMLPAPNQYAMLVAAIDAAREKP